ncbi:hypothetical protein BCF11_4418 [Collimonas sp. PA-H2]|uniref:hypothetical protein n=1 Tax=Collimonas sp. PA-H2 TaxID=1881062 RepID=UPI000BF4BA36|nr:hypothetical protein [Collimonas sp. PA-H2]PFH11950.1 hypothetical protein BCF11_4418 [Collimonas sp. PA-H2]
MKTYTNDPFMKDSLNKILGLATLTLYGVNVQPAVDGVIDSVFHHLHKNKPRDPDGFLLAFKNGLTTLADRADDSMTSYRKTLHDAALLIRMTRIPPHMKSVDSAQIASLFQKFQLKMERP